MQHRGRVWPGDWIHLHIILYIQFSTDGQWMQHRQNLFHSPVNYLLCFTLNITRCINRRYQKTHDLWTVRPNCGFFIWSVSSLTCLGPNTAYRSLSCEFLFCILVQFPAAEDKGTHCCWCLLAHHDFIPLAPGPKPDTSKFSDSSSSHIPLDV